jgi:hypothetical protein
MSQTRDGFEKYSESWKTFQEPMQEFLRLNTDTLKSFQNMKVEEFGKISRPDELWEKQMQLAIANGEKAIDYMQKSLHIFEKALHSFAEECKTNTKNAK